MLFQRLWVWAVVAMPMQTCRHLCLDKLGGRRMLLTAPFPLTPPLLSPHHTSWGTNTDRLTDSLHTVSLLIKHLAWRGNDVTVAERIFLACPCLSGQLRPHSNHWSVLKGSMRMRISKFFDLYEELFHMVSASGMQWFYTMRIPPKFLWLVTSAATRYTTFRWSFSNSLSFRRRPILWVEPLHWKHNRLSLFACRCKCVWFNVTGWFSLIPWVLQGPGTHQHKHT